MERISLKQLEAVVNRINTITKSPLETYTETDGKYVSNIGNYHLDGAYGGYSLHRICNEGGGITDIFKMGHMTKRELYNLMQAYICGLDQSNS